MFRINNSHVEMAAETRLDRRERSAQEIDVGTVPRTVHAQGYSRKRLQSI
ncbi:hypothetical protein ACFLT2_12040 [Acidobacteriota bacterium]